MFFGSRHDSFLCPFSSAAGDLFDCIKNDVIVRACVPECARNCIPNEWKAATVLFFSPVNNSGRPSKLLDIYIYIRINLTLRCFGF